MAWKRSKKTKKSKSYRRRYKKRPQITSYASKVQRNWLSSDLRKLTLTQNYSVSYFALSRSAIIIPHFLDAHYIPSFLNTL